MSYAEEIHLLNFNKHLLLINLSLKCINQIWCSGSLIFTLVSREQLENMIHIK